MNEEQDDPKTSAKAKLPARVWFMCGWPLLLVVTGGAIGGGLGAAGFVINLRIYKSQLPTSVKVILNLFVGATAVVLWLVAVAAIRSMRN